MENKHPLTGEPYPVIEPIGFFIEGDYIVVANPCSIPIDLLKESLRKKRTEGEVSACFMIKLPLNFLDKTLKQKGVRG